VETSGRLGALQFIRKDTGKDQIQAILGDLFEEFFGDENTKENA